MSEKQITHYYCAGVFKFDHRSAGYPDLMKIAKEWAKDENFYEIIVRGVSDMNFGIQFVYIQEIEDYDKEDHPLKKYHKELTKQFGQGLYAWDYFKGASDESQKYYEDIVVLKEYKKRVEK